MNPIGRIISFAVACAFAYQSYDSFRSAFAGTQPKVSAPDRDPKAISARLGGVTWGFSSLGLSLLGFWACIFL
jgi:hypothetical protein